jgi:hypothetical protein
VAAGETRVRPAFYALDAGGWRDYVSLLHPPYTAWHLAYVAVGAAVASPAIEPGRLLPTLAAFFLAVGIAAHALDELNGRPLGTQISARTLAWLAGGSLGGAVAIGVYGALAVSTWIALFVVAGAVVAVAYNLELLGGTFHGDVQFALAWGSFPVLTGAFASAERISIAVVVAAAFAFLTSLAQRRLSTQVRHVRRRVASVTGILEHRDGATEPITPGTLIEAEERALRLLAAAHVVLGTALVIMRTV